MINPDVFKVARNPAFGILAIALGTFAIDCATSLAAQSPEPVPVVTKAVMRQDVPIVLKGLGTVQPLNTAVIRGQVVGFLQTVPFREGASVSKGDVLATIQPDIYQARLEQARAQLQKDQAQLDNLNFNINRNEPLLKEGFATDIQVADQKAKAAELGAALKADQAAIDYAQAELNFTTLRAPFDGVTGERLIDVGNLVHPTDPGGIVVLTQVQPISVVATVPASAIPAVQKALDQGSVPVDVYDQTGLRKLDSGTLLLIDNQAQIETGTVQLKATFPNAQRQLWPGTFVTTHVTTGVVKGALTVPTNAIQQNDQGQFVYVVGKDHRAEMRPVEVTERQNGLALISKGLQDGETVVVAGQYGLSSGSLVTEAQPGAIPETSTGSLGMLP